MKHWNCD